MIRYRKKLDGGCKHKPSASFVNSSAFNVQQSFGLSIRQELTRLNRRIRLCFQPPKGVERMCIIEDLTKLTASALSWSGDITLLVALFAYLGLHVQEW